MALRVRLLALLVARAAGWDACGITLKPVSSPKWCSRYPAITAASTNAPHTAVITPLRTGLLLLLPPLARLVRRLTFFLAMPLPARGAFTIARKAVFF